MAASARAEPPGSDHDGVHERQEVAGEEEHVVLAWLSLRLPLN